MQLLNFIGDVYMAQNVTFDREITVATEIKFRIS